MEVIRSKINHSLDLSNYLDPRSCFIDIETTGLARQRDLIYLIGVLYKKGEAWILDQFFLNDITREAELLEAAIRLINSFQGIINYNGTSFDLPFINARAEKYGLEARRDLEKSFDIYRLVRSNRDYLDLQDLKLKSLEEYLGYFREDQYSGYECIKFYKDYIVAENLENKERVLAHNFDDLVNMLDIMEIIDIIRKRKSLRLSSAGKDYDFYLASIDFLNDRLRISGQIRPDLELDLVNYGKNYGFRSHKKNEFQAYLELSRGYIAEGQVASFLNLDDYGFYPESTIRGQYRIPDYIYPVKIGKQILLENIQALVAEFIKNKIL